MATADSPVAIGIDLGTTHSCVAVFRNGGVEIIANQEGERTTPSCVAFRSTERLVGRAAVAQMSSNAANTIFDSKRLLGRWFDDESVQNDMRHWPFKVVQGHPRGGSGSFEGSSDDSGRHRPKVEVEFRGERRTFFPEEISSMILGKMKESAEAYLGCKVTKAVITVPAYFNDAQRRATHDAATIAGLDVLRMINEPTAAALAYGFHLKKHFNGTILVYDLGGGTFDVSILGVNGSVFKVMATAGDTHLGGEDFDNRMVDYFVGEFRREHNIDLSTNKRALRRLRTVCVAAKIALSSSTEAPIEVESLADGIDLFTTISRARFDALCGDLLRRTLATVETALRDAELDKSAIDEIVLVGGSSRIPAVQKLLRNFFEREDFSRSINPDEAVAYGAAVQAASLSGAPPRSLVGLRLIDVVPLSLGLETAGGRMAVVIKRNTPIPVRETRSFGTVSDQQRGVGIIVYEGERLLTKENNLLGTFRLSGIESSAAVATGGRRPRIEVAFEVDASGILHVTAVETSSGTQDRLTITNDANRFTKENIANLVREAAMFKDADARQLERISAKNDLEAYCLSVRRTLRGVEGKVNAKQLKAALDVVSETLAWLDATRVLDVDAYKSRRTLVEKAVRPLISGTDSGAANTEAGPGRRFVHIDKKPKQKMLNPKTKSSATSGCDLN